MAISWGAWSGVDRQIRLGIEVDWSAGNGGAIVHTSAQAKATVSYWVEVRNGSFSDEQTLNFGGWIDGQFTKINYQSGADGPKKWETRSKTYDYGANEYGSSPGSRTFKVWMTGAGGGNINPDHSVTKNIPARPYDTPIAPTNVNSSRISDTSIKTTWTNKETAGEPWDRVRVQWDSAANGLWNGDVGTPGGTSTSFTDSTNPYPNGAIRYRVRSENSVGNSAWVEGDLIYTTPAAPTDLVRTGDNGADQVITWTNNASEYIDHLVIVERAADGGAFVDMASLPRDSTTWTDTGAAASPATKYKYRARIQTVGGAQGTLFSDYSNESTETTGVSTPPNAPTNPSPANGTLINPTQTRNFTWQHNSTDNSAQTAFQIQWRVIGEATWTVGGKTTSSTQAWTAPANTFPDNSKIEWQVRTWGAASTGGADGTGASAWSALANFETVGDPNARRERQRVMRLDLETGRQETAPTGVLPPIGSMLMFGGAAAPSGWLLCQGQSLLRADYPDLFGVIGTSFGAADSLSFNLPNMSEKFPLGTSSGQTPNAGGGSKKITEANLPAHDHGPGTLATNGVGDHNHGVARRVNVGQTVGAAQGGGSASPDGETISSGGGAHSHTVTGGRTGATGSGTDYLPPYTRLNFIIKT